MPSNRALEADARRSHLRPTSRASRGRSLPLWISPLLLPRASRPPNFSLSLSLSVGIISFSLSLSLLLSPVSPRSALLRIQNSTYTLRCEDNGALKHALIPLSREFHVIARHSAWRDLRVMQEEILISYVAFCIEPNPLQPLHPR